MSSRRDRSTRLGLELAATLDGSSAAKHPSHAVAGLADTLAAEPTEPQVLDVTLDPAACDSAQPKDDESVVQIGQADALPPRIGRYLILRQLGRGGMGVVYSAYDPDLDRKVAIKVVRDGMQQRARGRSRVQQEAQAMARVSHPNVVHVYEVGEDHESQGGRIFIAMEFVPGMSLLHWQEQHPLRDPRAFDARLRLYLQAAAGLAAAHQCGLIHRDFKPDNVLVGDDGRARVLDFGLARALSPTSPVEEQPASSVSLAGTSFDNLKSSRERLTQAGSIMGTPGYMAPEQVSGDEADARSDQFSFCAALYEALYGVLPFPGETFEKFAENVRTAALPSALPRALGGIEVPTVIERALRRGLSRDPAARFPSMPALIRELEHGLLPDADNENTRRIKRRSTLVGIGILLGVIILRRILLRVSGPDPRSAVLMAWTMALAFAGSMVSARKLIQRQPRYRQFAWGIGALLGFVTLGRTLGMVIGLTAEQYLPLEVLGVTMLLVYDIPAAGRRQIGPLVACLLSLALLSYLPKYRIIYSNVLYLVIFYISGCLRLSDRAADSQTASDDMGQSGR